MAFVENIVLTFRVNGEEKTLSYNKLPFSAWSELKGQLNFTPRTLLAAVGDFDVEAVGALIWLERKQRERDLRWRTVAREFETGDWEFDPIRTTIDGEVVFEADDATSPTEEEPDPTKG